MIFLKNHKPLSRCVYTIFASLPAFLSVLCSKGIPLMKLAAIKMFIIYPTFLRDIYEPPGYIV